MECASRKETTDLLKSFMIEFHVIQEQFDPTVIGRRPTRVEDRIMKRFQLSETSGWSFEINIRKNEIEADNQFVSLGFKDKYTYYDIDPDYHADNAELD